MMIDLFFAIFAGYGFFLGFTKGIIRTVFSILSYIFGLLAAFKLAPATTRFLETVMGSDNPLLFIAGFLLAFFGTLLLFRFVSRTLSAGLQSANINIINQVAGGALLAAIMTLLYSLVLWFLVESHIIRESHRASSMTYPFLIEYPKATWRVLGKLRPTLQEFWDNSVEFMDRIEKVGVEKTEGDPNIYDIEDQADPPVEEESSPY
jgi:membrane protein required for colicin V production